MGARLGGPDGISGHGGSWQGGSWRVSSWHAAATSRRVARSAAPAGFVTARATVLATLVLVGLLVGPPARAQGAQSSAPVTLALPTVADRAAHAALVPAGPPARPEGGFDLVAVENAALAQADMLPAELWEVDALADELGVDLEASFDFVRDHLAFDPYSGVLRGAAGALAARAANAWDRALLLRALLEHQGYVTRLAFGELDDAAIDALLAGAAQGAPQPLADPNPGSVTTTDVQALATRAWRDHALLTQALDASGVLETLGAAGGVVDGAVVPDPRGALRSHVWVQLEQLDGTWLDLDPSTANAVPGDTLTPVTGTADELPPEAQHQVVVRVLVETLEDGALQEVVSLEQSLAASEAAGSETWLYFQPEAQGLGGALLGALGEMKWLPVLLVNGKATTGAAFPLGSGSDDSFGSFFGGGGGSQLTRLRLELIARAPDGTERAAQRVLFDRVDPSLREAGAVMAETLAALPNEGTPAALASLHHVLVSTGGMSPREQAIGRALAANFAGNGLKSEDAGSSYPLQDLLFPLAVADQAVVLASERVVVDGMSRPGMRAYVGGARAYLVSLTPFAAVENGTASIIDLALDGVAFVGAGGAAEEAHERLWYGVLQGALETEMTLARARAVDPATAQMDSVSLRMGEALAVLRPGEAEAAPAAAAELRAALRSGDIAVTVGTVSPSAAFWAIEPATGATRSVVEPGLRIGFIGGGNYTNSSAGGPRYVIDPQTGNTIGHIKDGKLYRYGRAPTSRCGGGTEYVVILGCVSIPASMTVGMVTGVVVTAVVAWAVVILEVALY